MNILMDGASSFSGFWFAKTLAEAGHTVSCIFSKKSRDEYEGIRAERVKILEPLVRPLWAYKLGSDLLLCEIRKMQFDVYCHHAFDVSNYKSDDYSPINALNSVSIPALNILAILKENGCKTVIVSGSYFERGMGKGSDNLPAFSPYAVAKSMEAELFIYHTQKLALKMGRFIMPNPFGTYEEKGLTSYLAKQWINGLTPEIQTPDYIRDNCPINLLANSYLQFTEEVYENDKKFTELKPSGFVSSVGEFVKLFLKMLGKKLDTNASVKLLKQTEFNEPKIRYNSDSLKSVDAVLNNEDFWTNLASYYKH